MKWNICKMNGLCSPLSLPYPCLSRIFSLCIFVRSHSHIHILLAFGEKKKGHQNENSTLSKLVVNCFVLSARVLVVFGVIRIYWKHEGPKNGGLAGHETWGGVNLAVKTEHFHLKNNFVLLFLLFSVSDCLTGLT